MTQPGASFIITDLLEEFSEFVSDSKEVSRSTVFLVLSTNRRQNTWKTISSHTESTVLIFRKLNKNIHLVTLFL
jgi:predicted methyltransferase